MTSTNGMQQTIRPSAEGDRLELLSPTAMPRAASFLWNRSMLVHVNCRGFVTARHMQPEPSRYSYAPLLEQETFMQPEQPHYGNHPGRFVYLRDDESGAITSVPYEPVRQVPDEFVFSVGRSDVEWRTTSNGISACLRLSLPVDDVVELWSLEIENRDDRTRSLSAFPSFSIGYMSWMNQGALYRDDLGGIVATCVTPYQKLADLEKILKLRDLTFLLHDQPPVAWETCRERFEGEGGSHSPDALRAEELGNGTAQYESPIAALQYKLVLEPGESRRLRFLFGPARNDDEIRAVRSRYFDSNDSFARAGIEYDRFLQIGQGCISIETPDAELDAFVNHWLNRQVYYHGTSNRLTTDPQTRNYLQDAMGMAYVDALMTRDMFVRALGQQRSDGQVHAQTCRASSGHRHMPCPSRPAGSSVSAGRWSVDYWCHGSKPGGSASD